MDYSIYDKKVQEHLKNIIRYLVNRYGEYKPEWDTLMSLLADNLDLYLKCRESVKENGIYDKKTARKNPLLSTMKDLQSTILTQIRHIGSSPLAESKIKQNNVDDTEDYIDGLLK